MFRFFLVLLTVGLVAGVVYFFANYRTEVETGEDGVEYLKITRRNGKSLPLFGSSDTSDTQSAKAARPPIRIATFDLGRLDEHKLANRRVSEILVRVIPSFDVVAVQNIRAGSQGLLVRLVERINATGRNYDFAVDPRLRSGPVEQYSAFLFDQTGIEIDNSTGSKAYWVEDPERRLRHKPLVALFRVKGPHEAEAFTFKLINVHAESQTEVDLLDEIYRTVRDDGPDEDDVILLGRLGAGDDRLVELSNTLNITCSIVDTPTTTRGTRAADNILFNPQATTEFTGRSEVMDLMREFDLTLQGALEVSEHLPVWAEFSSYEGGRSGRMAEKGRGTLR